MNVKIKSIHWLKFSDIRCLTLTSFPFPLNLRRQHDFKTGVRQYEIKPLIPLPWTNFSPFLCLSSLCNIEITIISTSLHRGKD